MSFDLRSRTETYRDGDFDVVAHRAGDSGSVVVTDLNTGIKFVRYESILRVGAWTASNGSRLDADDIDALDTLARRVR